MILRTEHLAVNPLALTAIRLQPQTGRAEIFIGLHQTHIPHDEGFALLQQWEQWQQDEAAKSKAWQDQVKAGFK